MTKNIQSTPKEKLLKLGIVGSATTWPPFLLTWWLLPNFNWVSTVIQIPMMIATAFVVVFYLVWTLGYCAEGGREHIKLMGDDNLYVARPYFPWGPYQREVRKLRSAKRRQESLRELEYSLGITDHYPLG